MTAGRVYNVAMLTAAIFSWVLAPAPVSQPPTEVRAPDILTIDVERSDDTAQITARDINGEISAEMFIWLDGDGRTRLNATWPDGLYVSVIADGETVTVDSDNQREATARMQEIHDFLQQTDPQAGPVPCAVATVSGIFHAITANPLVVVDAVLAACECLPLVVDEWEGYHCPGF
jgi:hypothetical protein